MGKKIQAFDIFKGDYKNLIKSFEKSKKYPNFRKTDIFSFYQKFHTLTLKQA
jgi:hypothetical protein